MLLITVHLYNFGYRRGWTVWLLFLVLGRYLMEVIIFPSHIFSFNFFHPVIFFFSLFILVYDLTFMWYLLPVPLPTTLCLSVSNIETVNNVLCSTFHIVWNISKGEPHDGGAFDVFSPFLLVLVWFRLCIFLPTGLW